MRASGIQRVCHAARMQGRTLLYAGPLALVPTPAHDRLSCAHAHVRAYADAQSRISVLIQTIANLSAERLEVSMASNVTCNSTTATTRCLSPQPCTAQTVQLLRLCPVHCQPAAQPVCNLAWLSYSCAKPSSKLFFTC